MGVQQWIKSQKEVNSVIDSILPWPHHLSPPPPYGQLHQPLVADSIPIAPRGQLYSTHEKKLHSLLFWPTFFLGSEWESDDIILYNDNDNDILIYNNDVINEFSKGELTKTSSDAVMEENGRYFVGFLCKHGYDKVMRLQGRYMSDFLNCLDNLHEYLR